MNGKSTAMWTRLLYGTALTLAAFTGFGNMPLYRRYYVADLPGFAWSGDFFANLYIHYTVGAVLLAMSVYFCIQHGLIKHRRQRITRSGLVRGTMLCLVLGTGVVMAVKNLPGTSLPFPWVAVLTLGHMALAVVAVAVSVFCAIMRWPWVVPHHAR